MNRNLEEHIQTLMEYLAEQKIENALDYLETLSVEERDCWEINNITGMVCSYCGEYEEAISFFRKALQKNPDTPDIYYNLADAYFALRDYEHAELMLKSCEYITDDEQLLEAVQLMREQLTTVNTEKRENNVLMVAYYFPPLSGSGVFRSLKFAKYLPELGWKTSVISAEEPPKGWNFRDDSMMDEIPQEVNVVRIADAVCTQSSIEMSKEQVGPVINFLKDVLKYDREALNIFGSFLSSQKGIMQMITFPCASLCWAWEVVKYIENNVDLKKLDVLYTTSGPASAHLVGFYISKKYGIPWVTDFRDPWTYNAYGYYDEKNPLMKLLYRLERLLLQNANYNLVVGEGQTEHYVNKFEVKSHQMVCITNGYDEEDFADLEFTTKKNERFTIGYSGLIYTGQQSILPIFQALKELREEGKIDTNEIAFRIVGQGKEEENRAIADKYGLANTLEQTGYLSHKDALQNNQDSDALLLLVGDDEKCKQVYTGKVFEYLRSGKYILAIAPKEGYVDDLLSATGHGETFLSSQTAEIKSAILREYQAWKSESEKEFACSPLIKLRERKYLTMKLADVLLCAERTEKKVEELRETNESVYNAAYLSGGAGKSYHKHYTQSFYYPSWKFAIKYLLMLNRDTSILEIGCGVGQFANMLFDYGFNNYKGFDYAEEGVRLAQKNNPENAEKFFVADAFKTDEITKQYGIMICFEVLEHIQDDLGVLKRIPKGTKLLLSVPNFDDPYHVRYFSSEKDVYERYKDEINIFDIGRYHLSNINCLYYLAGEKL